MPPVRVAIVHDWLTGMRGGERVLHELVGLFDEPRVFTLIHAAGASSPRIEGAAIEASPLSRIPGARRHYRKFLPLFPWAIGRFHLAEFDLVLSSSHAFAKGVQVPAGVPHVCYCHTPMRYVWDLRDAYVGDPLLHAATEPAAAWLRRWDVSTSGPERVTRFVANSRTVADRIRRHYGRESTVVYPPVDLDVFRPSGRAPGDHYLLVTSFVPYKREDLAIEAFRRLGRPLVVVGDGPGRERLARSAPSNVRFTGRVTDEELARLYASCRALVHPQEEDLGLAAIEAQACGRPVIAFGRGGATETVVAAGRGADAPATGVFFGEQSAEALAGAVLEFERAEPGFDAGAIRAHAAQFGKDRFRSEMRAAVDDALCELSAGAGLPGSRGPRR